MTRLFLNKKLTFSLTACVAAVTSSFAMADFINDSHAAIEMRNMYMNRDFRNSNSAETMKDWGQGFTLQLKSGFTEGTVGFGLDVMAQQGIKLDSGKGRSGTGVLLVQKDGTPAEEWSDLGGAAKMRLSKSTLAVGTLQPVLPVVMYNDTRLLATTFTGGLINSQEIEGLAFNAGRLTETKLRNSSNREDMSYAYNGATSDHFDFAGGSYQISKQLSASYYYGALDNVYQQHFIGLVHNLPLAEGVSLRSDLRYFRSDDTGQAQVGKIGNNFFNGMLTLGVQAHKFGVGLQHINGEGNIPFLSGTDPYSINLVTYNTFTKANTDAWQVRYDYDFAALGVPGLTFMSRYVSGSDIESGTVTNGREWERDSDLGYVIQNGPLKGVNLRWRNVTFRSSNGLTNDLDENRIILGYTLALW
ncbi:outer membrane porin, OprD family [Pseudomonas helleri]|nr:outer membrane porin, OprD family [Pseudomonas helleri]MQU21460.1 outer membrane porin, OprD family [Pseudomonas helleri]